MQLMSVGVHSEVPEAIWCINASINCGLQILSERQYRTTRESFIENTEVNPDLDLDCREAITSSHKHPQSF